DRLPRGLGRLGHRTAGAADRGIDDRLAVEAGRRLAALAVVEAGVRPHRVRHVDRDVGGVGVEGVDLEGAEGGAGAGRVPGRGDHVAHAVVDLEVLAGGDRLGGAGRGRGELAAEVDVDDAARDLDVGAAAEVADVDVAAERVLGLD